MKLLVLGDMAATGFGTVTQDLGTALLDLGVDARFLSWNEIPDLPEPFASRTAKLDVPDGWLGRELVRAKLEHLTDGALFEDFWAPDTALVLGDVGSMIESKILDWFPTGLPAYHYAPVEGIALPRSWARWWARFTPIAMSEFGATEIELVTGQKPPVIYHGIDTDAFYPVSQNHPITWRSDRDLVVIRSKREAKRAFGLDPDGIFIFRADANVVRKAYFEWFLALAPVAQRFPQVTIGVHCRPRDYGGDLDDMLSHLPDELRNRVGQLDVSRKFTTAGIPMPREVLAALYNAADIYVSNACEGFGLTIAEAMACGLPVVGMDWSAVPEVVGSAGLLVPPGRLYPNTYAHFWASADGEKLAEATTRLVTSRATRKQLGALGPLRVASEFRWPDKAAQFIEAMSPARIEVAA